MIGFTQNSFLLEENKFLRSLLLREDEVNNTDLIYQCSAERWKEKMQHYWMSA